MVTKRKVVSACKGERCLGSRQGLDLETEQRATDKTLEDVFVFWESGT
jgi:hypothetical protein